MLIYILILLLYGFMLLSSIGVAVFLLGQIYASLTTVAPFISVPEEVLGDIVAELNLTPGSVFYDVGCGDGRLLRAAVKTCPDITAIGIERSWYPYILARWTCAAFPRISILRQDIFASDFSKATHVFAYLSRAAMPRLCALLRTQCRPGTQLISCDFSVEGVTPQHTIDLPERGNILAKRLFIYTL